MLTTRIDITFIDAISSAFLILFFVSLGSLMQNLIKPYKIQGISKGKCTLPLSSAKKVTQFFFYRNLRCPK
jgi:hypothetical protein